EHSCLMTPTTSSRAKAHFASPSTGATRARTAAARMARLPRCLICRITNHELSGGRAQRGRPLERRVRRPVNAATHGQDSEPTEGKHHFAAEQPRGETRPEPRREV